MSDNADYDYGDDMCMDCGKGPYDCECHLFDECGKMPDGVCLKAGSEFCDFECLLRNESPNTRGLNK
jgi:hypothetical protein